MHYDIIILGNFSSTLNGKFGIIFDMNETMINNTIWIGHNEYKRIYKITWNIIYYW
jgi:hypothetical protein